jgi:type VII secretion protein EccB
MWSRRDQIQAYQFLRRRTVSAVLVGDANHPESPTRRTVIGLMVGCIVLLLVLAGFGIAGLLRSGSSTAWQKAGAVVVEKETGARFIRDDQGALHPVLNYASAQLITGGSGDLVRVSRKSLAAAGRGQPVGITGAPDSLPAADRLVKDPWTACSSTAQADGPTDPPRLSVILGRAAPDSRSIVLGKGAAVVVKAGSTVYLVADGQRFRVRDNQPDQVLQALGLATAPQVNVSAGWVATLPAGPDLGHLQVPGRGQVSQAVPGVQARVGQVFVQKIAGDPAPQYLLLLPDGLARISITQARLVLGDPKSAAAYPSGPVAERGLAPALLARARLSAADVAAEEYPARPPDALDFTQANEVTLCARPQGFRSGVPAMTISLNFALPAPSGARPITVTKPPGQPSGGQPGQPPGPAPVTAGTVLVAPGAGAVVRSVPAQDVTTGPVYLVTDLGRRYALPDAEASRALGYGRVSPVPMPASVIDLLTEGPALDRAAANLEPGLPSSSAGR